MIDEHLDLREWWRIEQKLEKRVLGALFDLARCSSNPNHSRINAIPLIQ